MVVERGGVLPLIIVICSGLIRIAYHYAKEAPLFIITLKESGDKLQLWEGVDYVLFMDADDSDVSTDYIEKNWDLLKDIIKRINKLEFVPENLINLMKSIFIPKDIYNDQIKKIKEFYK